MRPNELNDECCAFALMLENCSMRQPVSHTVAKSQWQRHTYNTIQHSRQHIAHNSSLYLFIYFCFIVCIMTNWEERSRKKTCLRRAMTIQFLVTCYAFFASQMLLCLLFVYYDVAPGAFSHTKCQNALHFRVSYIHSLRFGGASNGAHASIFVNAVIALLCFCFGA